MGGAALFAAPGTSRLIWASACSAIDATVLPTASDEAKLTQAVQTALEYQNGTQGSNVYFMMGSDFQYENADEWRGFALAEALHIVNQNASNLDAIGRRLGM